MDFLKSFFNSNNNGNTNNNFSQTNSNAAYQAYQQQGNAAYTDYLQNYQGGLGGNLDQATWNQQNNYGLNQDQFAASLQQQPQGLTAGDWAGVGVGAFNTGLGFLTNRAQLDQGQQALDLNKEKFSYLKSQDADTRAATTANIAASRARVGG